MTSIEWHMRATCLCTMQKCLIFWQCQPFSRVWLTKVTVPHYTLCYSHPPSHQTALPTDPANILPLWHLFLRRFPLTKSAPVPVTSSMEPLSSVLTSLSRCGSRSQCKGAAVPGSPCVCVCTVPTARQPSLPHAMPFYSSAEPAQPALHCG